MVRGGSGPRPATVGGLAVLLYCHHYRPRLASPTNVWSEFITCVQAVTCREQPSAHAVCCGRLFSAQAAVELAARSDSGSAWVNRECTRRHAACPRQQRQRGRPSERAEWSAQHPGARRVASNQGLPGQKNNASHKTAARSRLAERREKQREQEIGRRQRRSERGRGER